MRIKIFTTDTTLAEAERKNGKKAPKDKKAMTFARDYFTVLRP
jgi:hypothetical protein